MRIIVVCLFAIITLSCSTDGPSAKSGIMNTKIHADLASDSRESIYRAMSFIEGKHGPPVPEGTNTLG